MSSVRGSIAAALALAVAMANPSAAANWREMGNAGATLDKLYLDMDSIKTDGAFKIAQIMVITGPQTNSSGFTFDRRVVTDGFDCANRKAVNIQTVGFMGDKMIGRSPAIADWQTKMKPLADMSSDARVLAAVCGGPAAPPGIAGPGAPPPPGQAQMSAGSGIFINGEGVVLTNAHVINGCKTLIVKAYNATPAPGVLESVDPKNDLALVRTHAGYGAPVQFRPQNRPARLGEAIGVIGYPLPGMLSSEPKATFGQINSVAGMNNDYTLLQISAPIQPGNSGGPVYDQNGLVLGIVVSTASPALIAKIGVVPQNINFAIRGEIAQIFMTAHGVAYRTGGFNLPMDTADIAAAGERSTAQIVCLKG